MNDFFFSISLIAVSIFAGLIYKRIYQLTKNASGNITMTGHQITKSIVEYISNFKYIKSTGSNYLFSNRVKNITDVVDKLNLKAGTYNGILSSTKELFILFSLFLSIFIQHSYFSFKITQVAVSLILFYRAMNYFISAQISYNKFLTTSGSLTHVTEFNNFLKNSTEDMGLIEVKSFSESIVFKNVFFDIEGTKILKNISFDINKNQIIGLTGSSGGGKTTLANLICSLYLPSKGDIIIDDINYKNINYNSLRKKIGYVSQESIIFDDSIFNNVTMWDKDNKRNRNKFWDALRMASIYDFVSRLNEKEQTILGDGGVQVSGGQAQRLSIAREIYKDVFLLILDEATSALDGENEKNVYNSINNMLGKVTMIVISHKLNTLKNTDKIIFLNNGQINQVGAFKELYSENIAFKQLVDKQKLSEY